MTSILEKLKTKRRHKLVLRTEEHSRTIQLISIMQFCIQNPKQAARLVRRMRHDLNDLKEAQALLQEDA